MAIDIKATARNVKVEVANYAEITLDIENLDLAECVDADIIIDEYSAGTLLNAMGGFEDWIDKGGVSLNEILDYVRDQGYKVEKE